MLTVCFVYFLFCIRAKHNLCSYVFFKTVNASSPAVLSHGKLAGQGKGGTSLMAPVFSCFWCKGSSVTLEGPGKGCFVRGVDVL